MEKALAEMLAEMLEGKTKCSCFTSGGAVNFTGDSVEVIAKALRDGIREHCWLTVADEFGQTVTLNFNQVTLIKWS